MAQELPEKKCSYPEREERQLPTVEIIGGGMRIVCHSPGGVFSSELTAHGR